MTDPNHTIPSEVAVGDPMDGSSCAKHGGREGTERRRVGSGLLNLSEDEEQSKMNSNESKALCTLQILHMLYFILSFVT